MATLSIRIPDGLKRKLASVAKDEGVSMNNYICSCLSIAVAQERSSAFFAIRLTGKDRDEIRKQFESTMSRTRKGRPPSMATIRKNMRSS